MLLLPAQPRCPSVSAALPLEFGHTVPNKLPYCGPRKREGRPGGHPAAAWRQAREQCPLAGARSRGAGGKAAQVPGRAAWRRAVGGGQKVAAARGGSAERGAAALSLRLVTSPRRRPTRETLSANFTK